MDAAPCPLFLGVCAQKLTEVEHFPSPATVTRGCGLCRTLFETQLNNARPLKWNRPYRMTVLHISDVQMCRAWKFEASPSPIETPGLMSLSFDDMHTTECRRCRRQIFMLFPKVVSGHKLRKSC